VPHAPAATRVSEREARGGTVIVGGGFAGGYVARILGKRGATIVSPENSMLFTALLPEAASEKGIADVLGLRFTGFLGWFITRSYHLWTTSLFFRRDIAELSMLGHPTRLDA
jgi:hypothetical protein